MFGKLIIISDAKRFFDIIGNGNLCYSCENSEKMFSMGCWWLMNMLK